jgi:Trm5-related predicted tRNA methylase
VVVRFVDIGGIVDHHYLSSLCFVDIGGIVDHHYLNSLLFVDIGGIVDQKILQRFVEYLLVTDYNYEGRIYLLKTITLRIKHHH